MSRYFNAFDAAIAAAGYNAFHELIALGVPALYVPMARETDDQAARARWAESAGLGLGTDGPADLRLEAQLDRLLDAGERDAIAERLAELAEPPAPPTPPAGSPASRRPLRRRASTRGRAGGSRRSVGATGGRAGSGREFRRRWGQFLASARTLARLTRQQLTQPRVRTVVLAVGIDDDAVAGAVAAALEESGEEPARTLVVTDSLALGPLRALGVGIEHVPGGPNASPSSPAARTRTSSAAGWS